MAKLIKIMGCDNPERFGDVIFVHGLGGDGLETWHANPDEIKRLQKQHEKDGTKPDPGQLDFWPVWLGCDRQDLGIWSLDYEVEPTAWRGDTNPLYDQANLVLEVFANREIGMHPVVFVTHSMGGLLIKQILRNAKDAKSQEWRQVAEQTKGILFVATPHVGSPLADKVQTANDVLLKILKVTASVEELSFGHSRLRELNDDFLQDEKLSKIPVWCFGETKPLPVVGIVVDEVSASLSKDLPLIRVTGTDHLTICRPHPNEREDSPVYNSTKRFLKKYLPPQ